MTEPTDAELDTIDMEAQAVANQNPIGTPFAWRKAHLAAFARAVLAKWGKPPAVAGEPVAWHVCSVNSDGSLSLEHAAAWEEAAHEHINDAITEHGIAEASSWVVRPAYHTPQPTHAQAGAVPRDVTPPEDALLRAQRRPPVVQVGGERGPAWR